MTRNPKTFLTTIAAMVGSLIFPAIASASACEPVHLGDIEIRNAWSRATTGASRPAIFYVEIDNHGAVDDRLVHISTPVAGEPMLHETRITDGVASMPHADAINLPAGKVTMLASGGYHGMLMDLTAALQVGQVFPLTMTFEKAGDVIIDVRVVSMSEEAPVCDVAP